MSYRCNKCGRQFSDEEMTRLNGHGYLVGGAFKGFKSKDCDGELIKEGHHTAETCKYSFDARAISQYRQGVIVDEILKEGD